jgi:hypothetical protein
VNDGPLIVQSDKTLLLEIEHERSDEVRTFAIHRITQARRSTP